MGLKKVGLKIKFPFREDILFPRISTIGQSLWDNQKRKKILQNIVKRHLEFLIKQNHPKRTRKTEKVPVQRVKIKIKLNLIIIYYQPSLNIQF